jgi:hypothetical protein
MDNTVVVNGKDKRVTIESEDSKIAVDGKGKKVAFEHKDNKIVLDGSNNAISLNVKKDVNLDAGGKVFVNAKGGIFNKGQMVKWDN